MITKFKNNLFALLTATCLISIFSCNKTNNNKPVTTLTTKMVNVTTLAYNGDVGNLAVDGAGNLFVNGEESYIINKVTPAGIQSTLTTTTVGSTGIAADAAGNIYTTANNFIYKTSPDGKTTTFAQLSNNYSLYALAIPSAGPAVGDVYATDGFSGALFQVTPTGIPSDFAISQAGISHCIAVDTTGNVYLGSQFSKIYKVQPNGTVTAYAGNGASGFVDGPAANASFNDIIYGIAVDQKGNLFVADAGNQRIRLITPQGMVSTIAGTGESGEQDGTGDKATFNYPTAIAINSAGNTLYVADYGGNKIRKITLN